MMLHGLYARTVAGATDNATRRRPPHHLHAAHASVDTTCMSPDSDPDHNPIPEPSSASLAMLRSLDFLDNLHLGYMGEMDGIGVLPSMGASPCGPQARDAGVLIPRLFLDVDGVIAPSSVEPLSDAEVAWVDTPATGRLHFRADVLARLVSLHTRQVVCVEWLTSRQETAPEVMAPALGLPDWHLNLRRETPPWWQLPYETAFWKERFVYPVLVAGERVVWCDDDIAFRANLAELAVFEDRLLAISPSSPHGLTMEDLDAIEAWAVHGQ